MGAMSQKMLFISNVLKEADAEISVWETMIQIFGFLVAIVIVLLSAAYTPAPRKPSNSVCVEIASDEGTFGSPRTTEDEYFSGFSLLRQDTPMVHDLRSSVDSFASDSTTPTWSLVTIPEEKEIVHDYDLGLRMYYPVDFLMN